MLRYITLSYTALHYVTLHYIITIVFLLHVLTTLVAILSEVHYKGLRILCNAHLPEDGYNSGQNMWEEY